MHGKWLDFGYTIADCMCDMGERESKWKEEVKINRIGKGYSTRNLGEIKCSVLDLLCLRCPMIS